MNKRIMNNSFGKTENLKWISRAPIKIQHMMNLLETGMKYKRRETDAEKYDYLIGWYTNNCNNSDSDFKAAFEEAVDTSTENTYEKLSRKIFKKQLTDPREVIRETLKQENMYKINYNELLNELVIQVHGELSSQQIIQMIQDNIPLKIIVELERSLITLNSSNSKLEPKTTLALAEQFRQTINAGYNELGTEIFFGHIL